MVATTFALFTLALSAVGLVRAGVPVPDTPGPNQTYNAGSNCPIAWSADTTGLWKNMAIELMTGNNWNMEHITTVTTLDASTTTSFSWTCPQVTINADIYFYQFTAAGQNASWTTRFTIASNTGATVPAPNTTQPDGQLIGWGVGALVDASAATAPPPWLASGSSSAASGSASSSASVVVPTSASATGSGSSSVASIISSSTAARTSSASASAAPSGAVGNATSANTTSGALGRADMARVLARSVTALAGVAAVFALAL
ncbi:hypothetical protein K488DRAFT_89929 [Vararia minispora EC-137]|uniref:Uncharacterized protein n=1 Tax=Vararia minispora EC-137 TaxID=1314806 RepID=A0ACB8Q936_9AGAM|nr:hypothetical protein K488DRAFT_89929 [Vararia minispora EC-137]